MKNQLAKMLAIGTIVMLGFASVSSAVVSEFPTTDTLANLAGQGGFLRIGDKTFSEFRFNPNGLTSFDASQIQVSASIVGDVYYLTWGGNISLAGTGLQTADLLLWYTVTADPGAIVAIDQSYTGSAQYGALAVDETVKIAGNIVIATSHLQVGDQSDPDLDEFNLGDENDQLVVNPAQHVLYVTKDIAFAINAPDQQLGLITISQVVQSFHQTTVPDGGSMLILFGSALSLLGLIKSRIA